MRDRELPRVMCDIKLESDIHTLISQPVSPTEAFADRLDSPKFLPSAVSFVPPITLVLLCFTLLSVARSKVNACDRVLRASTWTIDNVDAGLLCCPLLHLQAMEELDIHAVASHALPPIRNATEWS